MQVFSPKASDSFKGGMNLNQVRKNSAWRSAAIIAFVGMIFVYCCAIVYINFYIAPSSFWQTDMYSDIQYSVRAWETKSVFPDGWVFGNQLYVVATPVLSAVFYGLLGNRILAMNLASTVMAVFVMMSFAWMIQSFSKSFEVTAVSVLAFLVLTLFGKDPIYSVTGWQTVFTLCSFYACYYVTAFLAFGCYLRSDCLTKREIPILLAAGILSFCTGIQSLRQTAIMILPLIVMEGIVIISRKCRGKSAFSSSTDIVIFLSLLNVLGLIFKKFCHVTQVEIFGSVQLRDFHSVFERFPQALRNLCSVFTESVELNTICGILIAIAAGVTILVAVIRMDNKSLCAVGLTLFAVGAIFASEVFTTIYVRRLYYFMIFPLGATVVACLYRYVKGKMRVVFGVTLVLCAILTVHSSGFGPNGFFNRDIRSGDRSQVCDYLMENDIHTIYSQWNLGHRISIDSDFQIDAGFWDAPSDVFKPVMYLCDPQVYCEEPEHAAYIFNSEKAVEIAMKHESANNLTLLKFFPDEQIWIYTATYNLMQP